MTTEQRDALEADGYSISPWDGRSGGTRYYLTDSYGKDVGYLVDSDDGGTGTCRNVTRRAGHIASILRAA